MNSKWIWISVSIIVIVLILIGFWVSSRSDSPATSESATTTQPTTTTKTTTTWTKTGTAVTGSFADADTVRLADNSYRMYYSVQPEVKNNNFEVYSSTSTDGKSWVQDPGIRKTMATFPEVIGLGDGTFRMYFQNAGVIKSAVSSDGLVFTDEPGTRIDRTNTLGLTLDNVAAPTIAGVANSFTMVYRGTINTPYVGEKVPNSNTQLLLSATSIDGLTWDNVGHLAVDSRNSTLYGLADGPELLYFDDDDNIELSFWSYQGVFMSSLIEGKFTAPKKIFALAESTALNKFPTPTPGDPTYAKFNDTWYMYYGQGSSIDYAVVN
jgi:hypothetical protein